MCTLCTHSKVLDNHNDNHLDIFVSFKLFFFSFFWSCKKRLLHWSCQSSSSSGNSESFFNKTRVVLLPIGRLSWGVLDRYLRLACRPTERTSRMWRSRHYSQREWAYGQTCRTRGVEVETLWEHTWFTEKGRQRLSVKSLQSSAGGVVFFSPAQSQDIQRIKDPQFGRIASKRELSHSIPSRRHGQRGGKLIARTLPVVLAPLPADSVTVLWIQTPECFTIGLYARRYFLVVWKSFSGPFHSMGAREDFLVIMLRVLTEVLPGMLDLSKFYGWLSRMAYAYHVRPPPVDSQYFDGFSTDEFSDCSSVVGEWATVMCLCQCL